MNGNQDHVLFADMAAKMPRTRRERSGSLTGRLASLWKQWRSPELDLTPYRLLAMQLHYDLPREEQTRSVLLVTPDSSPSSGWAGVALGRCLAEELRQNVLRVDACPRAPELSRMLGVEDQRGLGDLLSGGSASLADYVLKTSTEYLGVLPAGTTPESARLEQLQPLMEAAQARNDFVIFTGGSVLSDPFALGLAPHVGCVLLLAVENETKVEDLDAAQDALSYCRARRVGLVLTRPMREGKRSGS